MVWSLKAQYEVVMEVRDRVRRLCASRDLDPTKACVYWAHGAVCALSRRGVRAVLQAGSASWPCVREADDDGVMDTHFSYMFEHSVLTAKRWVAGKLPEMHCWAGIPSTQVLIDLTTGYQQQRAKELAGLEWRDVELPPYFWGDQLPSRWRYDVDPVATRMAMSAISQLSEEEHQAL